MVCEGADEGFVCVWFMWILPLLCVYVCYCVVECGVLWPVFVEFYAWQCFTSSSSIPGLNSRGSAVFTSGHIVHVAP